MDQDRRLNRWRRGGGGCGNSDKQEISHLLSQADRSWDRLRAAATLEASAHLPFLLPLPQFLLLSVMLYGMEYSFGQFGSSVVPVSPPSLLPTPSLFMDGGGRDDDWQSGGGKNALTPCKHRSAVVKTLVPCQHCFSHKSKTQCHMGCYGEC